MILDSFDYWVLWLKKSGSIVYVSGEIHIQYHREILLKIELDLRKHCIETAIRRLYNRFLSEYLQDRGDNPELEEKLTLLQKALKNFDFPSLRSAHRELAGESDARIALEDSDGSLPGITINGRPVDIERCIR